MLSTTFPILQCEIAPRHARGFYVSTVAGTVQGAGRFRWGAVHLDDLPLSETTHWLIKNSFQMEGLRALADLHETSDESDPAIQASDVKIVATLE